MKVENAVTPSPQQIQTLAEGDPDDGPIYMLNLLRFKEKAEYEDGRETSLSGQEAYGIYAQEVGAHLAKVGGRPVFGGAVSFLMLGEVEDLWDMAAIAMYPSRRAMFEMVSSPDYLKSAEHRTAGLAGQLNIEVRGQEMFG